MAKDRLMNRQSLPAYLLAAVALVGCMAPVAPAQEVIPAFSELLSKPVALKPELVGVHPRVFVTKAELEQLRQRAKTTHRDEWQKVLANLVALKKDPDPAPGSQDRRAQNNVALAMAGVTLAAAIEQQPQYVAAAKRYVLTAIDYEPWGYTFDKPNTDLAAAHLLYSIGWAYDLLYDEFTPAERGRIRASLERHAGLVYDAFAPKPGKRFAFTQNHNFIPTAGLAVTALALMGESADAPKWAALARAHHHRAGQLLSPDGNFYEGMEYLDLLGDLAGALPRRLGALDRRGPVGPRAVQELEVLRGPRRAAGRAERLRLRRHLAGAAHACEAG